VDGKGREIQPDRGPPIPMNDAKDLIIPRRIYDRVRFYKSERDFEMFALVDISGDVATLATEESHNAVVMSSHGNRITAYPDRIGDMVLEMGMLAKEQDITPMLRGLHSPLWQGHGNELSDYTEITEPEQ
jgi:hypothetical protein